MDEHAVGRYAALRTHQQLEALAGHQSPAHDADRADRDDFIAAHVQAGGLGVEGDPFARRGRIEEAGKLWIGETLEAPAPLDGCERQRQRGTAHHSLSSLKRRRTSCLKRLTTSSASLSRSRSRLDSFAIATLPVTG